MTIQSAFFFNSTTEATTPLPSKMRSIVPRNSANSAARRRFMRQSPVVVAGDYRTFGLSGKMTLSGVPCNVSEGAKLACKETNDANELSQSTRSVSDQRLDAHRDVDGWEDRLHFRSGQRERTRRSDRQGRPRSPDAPHVREPQDRALGSWSDLPRCREDEPL